jgi:hypothetical protein
MAETDDEIGAIALRHARALGYDSGLVVERIVAGDRGFEVLLGNPAYARGGGLLVIVDDSGTAIDAIPQL